MSHTAVGTTTPGKIYLNGVPLRLKGEVSPVMLGTPGPRLLIGDDVNKTNQTLTTLTHPDATLGIGLFKMDDITQANFCWFSLLDTSVRGTLILPEEVVTMGAPAALTAATLQTMFDHDTYLFGVFSGQLFRWDDSADTWDVVIKDFGAAATSSLQFLYSGTTYAFVAAGNVWRTSTPATGGSWTDLGVAGEFLAVWDDKLFRMTTGGACFVSTDGGTTWTTAKGTVPTQSGWVTGLSTYYDADGAIQLYCITREGLFILDYANATWAKTRLIVPPHTDAGKGASEWRNDFFYSAGLDVYRYIVAPTATVSDVGLNRLDGIPSDMDGIIVRLVPGHNELYALLDSSLSGVRATPNLPGFGAYKRIAGPFGNNPPILSTTGYSSVLAWSGAAWRVLWRSTSTAVPGDAMFVSQANSDYRLVWGTDYSSYYIVLPRSIRNPRRRHTKAFQLGPLTHETPWFAGASRGLTELAVLLFLRATNTSATEKVTVEYGVDLVDTWYAAFNKTTGASSGIITADGLYEFAFDTVRHGKAFDYIRFRITLESGSSLL